MAKVGTYRTRQRSTDRISYLPTEIQTQILSLLPDREALETRILSTQWKNICSSRCIQFNIPHCNSNGEVNTINISLHLVRGFKIETLKIHGHHVSDPKLVQDLHERISFIVTRNIVQLELVFWGYFENLPRPLFTCETLTILKLRGIIITDPPKIVYFHNLKTLTLEFVEFWNQIVTTEFFKSCPVLECLNIRHCKLHCVDHPLFISSPILKALEIDSASIFARGFCIPSAIQFNYRGQGIEKIIPITNLCNASFNFVSPPCILKNGKTVEDCAFHILKHTSKIVKLSLLGYFLQYLVHEPDLSSRLPASYGLEYLELAICPTKEQIRVITCLFSAFPDLQTLHILIEGTLTEKEQNQEPEFPTDDVLMKLKRVEVKLFEGSERELDIVKYFLGNARVLEKMNIMLPEKNKTYMKRRGTVNREIQKFVSGYPNVVILISQFQIELKSDILAFFIYSLCLHVFRQL